MAGTRTEILRFFMAIHKGSFYRVYVTSIDVLCVRMSGAIPGTGYIGGGLIGGIAAAQQYEEAMRKLEQEIQRESELLGKRDAEGIRVYIRAMKRGYQLDPDDLDEVRLDYLGKWKRLFFCSPTPAFIVRSKKTGRLKFALREKKDAVIALHELPLLFSDDLAVGLRVDDYKKALKKYEKIRDS